MKKKLLKRILCGTAAGFAALIFAGCGRAQINANDYVTIKFDGYNNYGTATANVDLYQMMTDNKEGFKLDKGTELDQLQVEMKLEEYVRGSLDNTTDLKNGDTVTFTWKNPTLENLEKDYNVRFTLENKTATVEGLKEPQDYDPFAGVKVEFEGFDGSGSVKKPSFGNSDGISFTVDTSNNGSLSNGDNVKISINGNAEALHADFASKGKIITKTEDTITVSGLEPMKDVDLFDYISVTFEGTSPNAKAIVKQKEGAPVPYLDFSTDKTENLANGDTIKVTLNGDYKKDGVNAASTEKVYTVEGLPYYISELSQLPDDVSKKMQQNDKDIFEARVDSNWEDTEKFKEMKFVGNYFIKPKEGVDFGWSDHYENKVYFVYKITASNPKDGTFSYYWASSYDNIMILDDGSCSFNLNDASYTSTIDERYNPGNSFSYNGIKDLDSLFSQLITPKIDKYTYENTVKDK